MSTDLLFRDNYYLTDGGLETTLIFHYGMKLPYFAAFRLVESDDGQRALVKYYNSYIQLAIRFGCNFILETPTWRANSDWGELLGYSKSDLQNINKFSVEFGRKIILGNPLFHNHFLISGNIGPRGDGYKVNKKMTVNESFEYHYPQIKSFAEEAVDIISAFTLSYSDEAIGIVKAAIDFKVPVVISFTVDKDGNLPGGETLEEAITRTDALSANYPSYYMINCAHPTHFISDIEKADEWKQRLKGFRANASVKSHEELDESETLDTGDYRLFTDGYVKLKNHIPDMKVIGGCCGTDHTHIEAVCRSLIGTR